MPDVLALCYHAVSPSFPALTSVTPDALERQISGLLARGYRPATFSSAVSDAAAQPTLAVTFDDSYRSVIERAFPILQRLGVPATVYVPTQWVGSQQPMVWPGIEASLGEHESELLPMSWDELHALSQAGWEIGSHSVSHPCLTTLDDAALARELGESRASIEAELGCPCPSIAYPYGDVDERVVAATRAAGYATGAALPKPLHAPRELEWPRIGIWHGDGRLRFALKVAPAGRALRARVGL